MSPVRGERSLISYALTGLIIRRNSIPRAYAWLTPVVTPLSGSLSLSMKSNG